MIRAHFLKIFREYPAARSVDYAGHPLATFIRHDFPDLLKSRFTHYPDLFWKASCGKGGWADSPWLAILDPLVTTSVQHGYFPIFFFEKGFRHVYLSFNQGIAELREEFSDAQAKEILQNRAKILRERASGLYQKTFPVTHIDLKAEDPHTRLAMYEPGHAFGKKYSAAAFPTDDELIRDLEEIIELYRLITLRGGTAEFDFGKLFDDDRLSGQDGLSLEDKRRLRYHKTIERNPNLAARVKRLHGYTCQVCGFNFEEIYGPLGYHFIEPHHKTPLSRLSIDHTIHVSARDDFAVVCSNCHRMIHRSDAPETFEEFVEYYRRNTDLFNYRYKRKSNTDESN